MDPGLLVALTLFLALLVGFFFLRRRSSYSCGDAAKQKRKLPLPPGPVAVPVLGNLLWLRRSLRDVEPLLRELHARYGPVVSLRVGSRLLIFVSDRDLAHRALVARGAAFADRPAPLPTARIFSADGHNITSAPYGPLWRLLRRNLVAETLHPSRLVLFAPARSWVLRLLLSKLRADAEGGGSVAVMGRLQFAMFALLVLMCFGAKLDEEAVEEIGDAQRSLLLYDLNIFAFAPWITKRLFRKRWETAMEMRGRQKRIYVPLIEARRGGRGAPESEGSFAHAYVDTLLGLTLPDEGGRALTDDEMVVLCSEFLNAGTDTTSTALEWIMAELVRNPRVQDRLRAEIEQVVGARGGDDGAAHEREVREEELQRMPYLKAVVLEGLRRHSPAHFVLPHAAAEEDAELGGYAIPKHASLNFMVGEMGLDGAAWEAPMEFRPERFLEGGEGADVDVTGSREIKMMPFGAGRRICAGINVAMLHLEYFVANMVREFQWTKVDGDDVDLTEKSQFTVVMKHPLRARLVPTTN
ncbi:cytochrome P450 89A2-like [Ananas comosus]|uniref:Cytochrome P450 89A2-like n=1 Tax=Ananas comosus TaxID=4615 RepID=A0A6P5FE24_ANACO|nr:cytochrome P450 89A2-like [Ananas comosus]